MKSSASTEKSLAEARAIEIKRRARALGFDLVGITTAAAPPHIGQFQRWLAEKFHGEMAYMERNATKRIAPTEVLPGARSIIVVGLTYYNGKSRNIAL